MTLEEIIKSIFVKTNIDDLEEREARIKGDADRTEYKHIVHVQLSGQGLGSYEDNNLYFVIRNYDPTLITSFDALVSNYEPYENITIYNEELDNTNMCVVRNTGNSVSYTGEDDLPIDIDGSNVIVIEDNCVQLS